MKFKALQLNALLLAVLVLFTSCASTTMIQSVPSDASVYVNGMYMGKTPYAYSDESIVGTCHSLRISKEGYEDFNTYLCRNEQADVGAIIGGIFFLFPFLWTMKYYPERTYELYPLAEVEEVPPYGKEDSGITNDQINRLTGLKALYDSDALTEEEFNTEKARILESPADAQNVKGLQMNDMVKLKKLKDLLDSGALTEQEFQTAKQRVLERMP
jgi:hypothetical protein